MQNVFNDFFLVCFWVAECRISRIGDRSCDTTTDFESDGYHGSFFLRNLKNKSRKKKKKKKKSMPMHLAARNNQTEEYASTGENFDESWNIKGKG